MTAIEARGATFDIGRVVNGTFGSVGRNAATFLTLGLILVGAPQAIMGYVQAQLNPGAAALVGQTRSPEELATYAALTIAVALLSVILSALLQAAVIRGVVEDLNGGKVSIADCLSIGLNVALPVIAISIMVGLGIALGLVLLVVPGVMLGIRWIVAVPARVMERPGVFAAMGRSAELTGGHRWAIFALALVFIIAVWVLSMVVGALGVGIAFATGLGAAGAAASLPIHILTALLAALTSTISAAGIASIYCELRSVKEGASPSALASVFD